MIDLTPNTTPKGEKCGTCRFAGTHTHAADRRDQTLVRCRRFPPVRLSGPDYSRQAALQVAANATAFPVLTWDDWCGEWEERDPEPEQETAPMGFRP